MTVVALAAPKLAGGSHLASGLPSCALGDVHIGDKISVTLSKAITVDTGGGVECNMFECPLSLPAPAARHVGPQGEEGGLGYVCISATAKVQLDDTCEIGRVVWLYASSYRSLYSSMTQDNPFLLLRALTPEKELICSDLPSRFPEAVTNQFMVCADQWIVELAPKRTSAAR